MISLKEIEKIYTSNRGEQTHALRGISLDVAEGEFITIVGPSGCGKTTLLKIIGGLIPKSAGEIHLEGNQITGPSAKIGLIFQSPVLLAWRTIYENIMLPVDVRKASRKEHEGWANELLELVGLKGFGEHYPSELSGGMQQRAALCRAMINDPRILLMDEPFGALDAMTRENMNVWLQRVWLESGKTVVFVTHSIPEAVFLADRVVVLSSRPGCIDEIITVDIPRPRSINVMTTERFGSYVGAIRSKFGSEGALD